MPPPSSRAEVPPAPRRSRRAAARAALVLGGVAIAAWLTFGMFPAMDRLRAVDDWPAFDQLHHAYERWSVLQVWVLLAVGACTAALTVARRAGAQRAPEPV